MVFHLFVQNKKKYILVSVTFSSQIKQKLNWYHLTLNGVSSGLKGKKIYTWKNSLKVDPNRFNFRS